MIKNLANFSFTDKPEAAIKVVGVGGGGGNAVNHMYSHGICDVDFLICNTDAQAMQTSPVQNRIQLGASLTEGRGAGNKPEIGAKAAEENINDVVDALSQNTKMVFITAGMGGGTGTGGAPVIAQKCQEMGYLTIGIVTIPFRNEGRRRIRQAIEGINQLKQHVDALLVVNNERIREMYGDSAISEAFAKADNILATAAKGIAEIITVPGYINVDFADVETVMRKSGLALMGTGIADGEKRAKEAVEKALVSPLLNDNDIRGAKNILLNITSGTKEVTMDEVGTITDFVQNKAGFDADIIWGNGTDQNLGDELSVTIIATGFGEYSIPEMGQADSVTKAEILHSISSKAKINNDELNADSVTHKPGQKTIEFDVSGERQKEENEFETLYPTTSRSRAKMNEEGFQKNYAKMSEDDVDEMENVPAYKRQNLRMNDPKYKKNFSKFTVNGDNKISDRNSYLHDKVD